jgi:hypothetical protein
MPSDNSTLREKIKIRQQGLSFVEQPYRVVDFYAGTGLITAHLWSKVARHVTCIEQKKGKFAFKSDNVTLIESDCVEHVDLCASCNVVDFDPYRVDWSFFNAVLDSCLEKTVIFLTVSYYQFDKNKLFSCVAREDIKAFKMTFSSENSSVVYSFFLK